MTEFETTNDTSDETLVYMYIQDYKALRGTAKEQPKVSKQNDD